MFEVGREYRIVTGVGEAEGYSIFLVEAYDAPLLKLSAFNQEIIVNTASPSFVSAEKLLRDDEKTPNPFDDL